jgi:hypothetical protein
MKVISTLGLFAGCMGLLALAAPAVRAQADTNPDHFEASNREPFDKAKKADGESTAIRYDGKVILPYAVQCNGKKLAPGRYSVSLRSDGKTFQATLKQKDQATEIVGVVHKQEYKSGGNVLLVEFKGKMRELSAIQLAELNMVLEPKPATETFPESPRRRFEQLLMTEQKD